MEWSAVPLGLALGAVLLFSPFDAVFATALVAFAVAVLVLWIVLQDVRTFTISDSAVSTLAILAIAFRLSEDASFGAPWPRTALALAVDASLCGGTLLLFREIYYRRKGVDGLGFGDVKLGSAGGLLVGTAGFSWALFTASLVGLAIVGATRLSPKLHGKAGGGFDKLAFGALLAPALWVVWIGQQVPVLYPAG